MESFKDNYDKRVFKKISHSSPSTSYSYLALPFTEQINFRVAAAFNYFVIFSVCPRILSVIIAFFSFILLPRNQFSVRFLRISSLCFSLFCMRFLVFFVHFHCEIIVFQFQFTVSAFLWRVPSRPCQTTL